jgi:tRNA-(ms[2]io[6]A)-hydroxylase
VEAVRADLVGFLQDHAANERKVSQSALRLAVEHPRRSELVAALVDVSCEELEHFRRVYRLLCDRGATLGRDVPDGYMTALRAAVRQGDSERYLLDRLLLFAVVEARGQERFTLLSDGLEEAALCSFYSALARAEDRHQAIYHELAARYFGAEVAASRLDELLDLEAEVARALPVHARLH